MEEYRFGPDACFILEKALYRLAESPRLWYDLFVIRMEDYGFELVPGIDCLMVNMDLHLLMIFYVDDIRLIYERDREDQAILFNQYLLSNFEVTQKEPSFFLGTEVLESPDQETLTMCQSAYLTKIGIKFGVHERTRFPDTPLPTGNLEPATDTARPDFIKGYQMKVGSIGHAAVLARPDVAKAYATLSQFLKNPSQVHMEAANHLIAYLYGTKDMKLHFYRDKPKMELYVDASFGDNPDRKSSQGFLMMMYGGAIDWQATKQKTVTKSTAEAELLALSSIAGNGYWWTRLFSEFDKVFPPPPGNEEPVKDRTMGGTKVFCNNQRAVDIANHKHGSLNTALRHVDIHQHWVRQETMAGRLTVEWIGTAKQRADGFTKNLPKGSFQSFRTSLGLR